MIIKSQRDCLFYFLVVRILIDGDTYWLKTAKTGTERSSTRDLSTQVEKSHRFFRMSIHEKRMLKRTKTRKKDSEKGDFRVKNSSSRLFCVGNDGEIAVKSITEVENDIILAKITRFSCMEFWTTLRYHYTREVATTQKTRTVRNPQKETLPAEGKLRNELLSDAIAIGLPML